MKRAIAAIAACSLFAACSQTSPEAPAVSSEAARKPRAYASVYPWAFALSRIAGDRMDAASVTPAGAEPHEFEPGARELARISGAKVFAWNGAGMDPWAEGAAREVAKAGGVAVEASSGIATERSGHGEEEEDHCHEEGGHEERGHHEGHEHGPLDPHVFLDPVLLKAGAEKIAAALSEADPAGSGAYRANMGKLGADLDALDAAFSGGLAKCALREAFVGHDAFGYLARRYKFETVAVSGLSPEEEPSPARLAELTKMARAKGVGYVFFETTASPKVAETLAREAGVATLALNTVETLSPAQAAAGKDYLSLQRENISALRTALRCE